MPLNIRPINKFDYESCYGMMIEFQSQSLLAEVEPDPTHAMKIIELCARSGISLIAEIHNKPAGLILSLRDRDLWFPKIIRLREIAWWVKPEYRGGSAGARLFKTYCESADQWIKQGLIQSYTISKLSSSPNFDYQRRGFEFVESTYIKEPA